MPLPLQGANHPPGIFVINWFAHDLVSTLNTGNLDDLFAYFLSVSDHPIVGHAIMAEAFGGPSGSEPHPLPEFTEDQRARWVALAVKAADEAKVPADPSFRSGHPESMFPLRRWRSNSGETFHWT